MWWDLTWGSDVREMSEFRGVRLGRKLEFWGEQRRER